MPRKAEYDTSLELGLCIGCNNPAEPGKTRCAKHAADRREAYRAKATATYACSYCGELGHNRQGCGAYAADLATRERIDAEIVARVATLDPIKNPFEWETRKRHKDALAAVVGEIVKAKTLSQAVRLARKLGGML